MKNKLFSHKKCQKIPNGCWDMAFSTVFFEIEQQSEVKLCDFTLTEPSGGQIY